MGDAREETTGWRLGALELPEDRELAGKLAGLLYLAGAGAVGVMAALPQVPTHHLWAIVVIALVGTLWGLACLTVIPWPTAPRWVSHFSSAAGFPLTAAAIALLGGADSPARFLLLFIAFYAAYFYPPYTAAVYLTTCCLAYALPLIYDSSSALVGELTVMVPTIALLGGGVAAGKRRLLELRAAAEIATEGHRQLAAEQGALRRLATAVAAGKTSYEIYGLVSSEAAELLGADASGVLRFDSPEEMTVVGSWGLGDTGTYQVGRRVPVRPGSDVAALWQTGEPKMIAEHQPDSPVYGIGYRCTAIAPVHVGSRLWGLIAIASLEPRRFTAETMLRLSHFAGLLATSVANTEDRRRLTEMATTDPLTGLSNHRTFHERLHEEVARAARHDRPLALALLDLDQFKEINDTAGHGVGDQVLARIGGDEFALLLPETTSLNALSLVDRVRAAVADERIGGYRLTLSGGISDLTHAESADDLFRYADGALYWSKAHGRDCAWVYDPEVVEELSAGERAERLERSRALSGLRALARAIDAKDAMTHRHSERVAALSERLATARGWPEERIRLLTEAALVHDVGKIGVRDAVLLKPGKLTDAEYEEVKRHAALGAQIAAEVLIDEQVTWIRGHHERPDGSGYPDGIDASQISEGAALLALADAFDVMTLSRPYSPPRSLPDALRECRDMVGRQFCDYAVAALESLHERGELHAAVTVRAPLS